MRCKRCFALMIFAALVVAALGFFGSAEAATLTWTDNATNESGVHIERATAPCSPVPATFTKIGEVLTNVVTYSDPTPVAGNKYCYRVRAWNLQYPGDANSAQYSAFSNLAELGLPLPFPAAPSLLGVTAGP